MNPLLQPLKVILVAVLVFGAIATLLFAGSVGGGKTDAVNIADAQLPPGSIMTMGTAHSHHLSMPLSQMSPCPAMLGQAVPVPKREPAGNFLSDPIVSFEGLHVSELPAGDYCSIAHFASDDSGAVGSDYYVQVVNTAIAVYDKSGNVLAGPVSTSTFWEQQHDCGGGGGAWSDAVVRFDRYANRWVISSPGGAHGQDVCVGVSHTSDPMGQYDQYAFEVNNRTNHLSTFFSDYQKISVFPDAYYATAQPNLIGSGLGNTISAFERAAMLTGNPAPQFVTFFVPSTPLRNPSQMRYSHMLAADLDGRRLPPRGSPEYVVQVQESHSGYPADLLQVYEFHVDWTSPSSSTFIPSSGLVPQPFNSNVCPEQTCIEQPGVFTRLNSVSYGSTMMQRLTYRNFGGHQMMLFNQTVAADGDPSQSHAGIRWYELRMKTRGRTPGPWEIYQQGTYAPDANDRWLGSMAMDRKGNIVLGFNVSGATVFPSIRYVGRRPNDPLGTLPVGELFLIDGGGVQEGQEHTAFGDYSQMTIDPVDDCTFWYTGTYLPTPGTPNDWHTRIGSFRFADCHGRD
jgi:hypothetical protein